MTHRPERLAEMIREELMDIIAGELRDPRVGLAQVTEVKLAPDLHLAHVYVSVMGNNEEAQQTLKGLIAARGYLRAQLAPRLHLRQVPELRIELDRSEEYAARLDMLLKRDRKRHPEIEDNQKEQADS